MGLGTSIFLIAVGAILDFAVNVHTTGFNLNTIGVILMIVGAIGVVLSLIFWSSWGGFGGYRGGRDIVVDDVPRRRVMHEEIL
jgi:hypothetical protein